MCWFMRFGVLREYGWVLPGWEPQEPAWQSHVR